MNEMEIVRKIMQLMYLLRQENGMLLQHKSPRMSHRDIMVLDTISKLEKERGAIKMKELSAYFDISPAAVSQGIRMLENKGWIKRGHLPQDRRSVYISLTPSAQAELQICAQEMKENLASFITLLGTEDAQALVRILEKGIRFTKDHHNGLHKCEEGAEPC